MIDWSIGDPKAMIATIELTVTKTVKVKVMNQGEAGAICDKLVQTAREQNPDALIGCGVTHVRLVG